MIKLYVLILLFLQIESINPLSVSWIGVHTSIWIKDENLEYSEDVDYSVFIIKNYFLNFLCTLFFDIA